MARILKQQCELALNEALDFLGKRVVILIEGPGQEELHATLLLPRLAPLPQAPDRGLSGRKRAGDLAPRDGVVGFPLFCLPFSRMEPGLVFGDQPQRYERDGAAFHLDIQVVADRELEALERFLRNRHLVFRSDLRQPLPPSNIAASDATAQSSKRSLHAPRHGHQVISLRCGRHVIEPVVDAIEEFNQVFSLKESL